MGGIVRTTALTALIAATALTAPAAAQQPGSAAGVVPSGSNVPGATDPATRLPASDGPAVAADGREAGARAAVGPPGPARAGAPSPTLAPRTSAAAASGNYRVRTQVVFGQDPCPVSSNPDEIIVCARRPDDERYRIDPVIRREQAEAIKRADNVAAQRSALVDPSQGGGIGSGTAVGPGGVFGAKAAINVGAAARTVIDAAGRVTESDDE